MTIVSYHNIPKAIFYLLKGEYMIEARDDHKLLVRLAELLRRPGDGGGLPCSNLGGDLHSNIGRI